MPLVYKSMFDENIQVTILYFKVSYDALQALGFPLRAAKSAPGIQYDVNYSLFEQKEEMC